MPERAVLFVSRGFLSLGLTASGGGLSRTFISFPGVFFDMLMCQNERKEGPGSLSGQLYFCLGFVWFLLGFCHLFP